MQEKRFRILIECANDEKCKFIEMSRELCIGVCKCWRETNPNASSAHALKCVTEINQLLHRACPHLVSADAVSSYKVGVVADCRLRYRAVLIHYAGLACLSDRYLFTD